MSFKAPFTETMPLAQAQSILRTMVDDGANCPCCTQLAKVYKRKVNAGMARSLIVMFRAAGLEWQHVPTTVGRKSAEEGKLAYWGLIEEEKVRRPDGGRAGYWRVTPVGEDWIHHRVSIQKYAKVYDGRCLGFDGERVSIHDALGTRFSYDDLMAGV